MPPLAKGGAGVNGQVKVKIPGQRPVMGLPWNRKSQSTKRKNKIRLFTTKHTKHTKSK
jgi:hypothetical protein